MSAAAAAAAARHKARKKRLQKKNSSFSPKTLRGIPADGIFDDIDEPKPISKYKNPDLYTGVLRQYILFGQRCEALATNENFNMIIILVICVAGVLVGFQTYDHFADDPVLENIDLAILVIFTLEVVLKLFAEQLEPWAFFTGKEWQWNNFDLIVVVLCMPGWGNTFGGSSPQLLRLVRLLRVMKLVKKIPQLQIIVMGLIGGLKSIGYILLLLMLVFYLYAIIGIEFFGRNDPFHFGSLHIAMVTLFRMATLEDWTDVLYVNYYGCGSPDYDSGIYTVVASDAVQAPSEGVPTFCSYSNAEGALAVFYFTSFIVISALVMLSLFVGAVTMSMTESMETMKEEKEQAERRRRMLKAKKRVMLTSGLSFQRRKNNSSSDGLATPSVKLPAPRSTKVSSVSPFSMTAGNSPITNMADLVDMLPTKKARMRRKFRVAKVIGRIGKATRYAVKDMVSSQDEEQVEEHARLREAFAKAWEGVDLMDVALTGTHRLRHRHKFKQFYHNLAVRCGDIIEHQRFSNFIIFVIILAGLQVGLSTYESIYPELQTPTAKLVFMILDNVILFIFSVEVVLKTIAEGFKPWRYFYKRSSIQGWNCFDYVVVAGSLLPGSGSMIVILRLLRLLRVLKLVKSLPALQIIVVALLKGVGSISYIGVILGLVFYVFAVLGMVLFKDNDPWHFSTLHDAIITLFRCSTLEDWTDVMYINMYGCNNYGYVGIEDMCVNPRPQYFLALLYFIIFTLIGALVLMTLFIGVVTTSMEEATSAQQEQQKVRDRVKEIQLEYQVTQKEIVVYETVFGMLDLDNSGEIEEEELRVGLEMIGKCPSMPELRKMVTLVDKDGSGEIDFAEFVEFMCLLKKQRVNPKTSPHSNDADDDSQLGEQEDRRQSLRDLVMRNSEAGLPSNDDAPLSSPLDDKTNANQAAPSKQGTEDDIDDREHL